MLFLLLSCNLLYWQELLPEVDSAFDISAAVSTGMWNGLSGSLGSVKVVSSVSRDVLNALVSAINAFPDYDSSCLKSHEVQSYSFGALAATTLLLWILNRLVLPAASSLHIIHIASGLTYLIYWLKEFPRLYYWANLSHAEKYTDPEIEEMSRALFEGLIVYGKLMLQALVPFIKATAQFLDFATKQLPSEIDIQAPNFGKSLVVKNMYFLSLALGVLTSQLFKFFVILSTFSMFPASFNGALFVLVVPPLILGDTAAVVERLLSNDLAFEVGELSDEKQRV